MSARETAIGFLERGLAPIPIPAGAKKPRHKKWQDLRFTPDDVPKRFKDGDNVGVLLGEPSGWLIDVDLDWREARALADMLPRTHAVFGRASSPRSHRLYVSEGAETRQYRLPAAMGGDPRVGEEDHALMVVELRSTGCQTVFPGSTHPSGEAVEWDKDKAPAPVAPQALTEAAGKLAAAAVLVRLWPAAGARDDCSVALCGALVRDGMDADDADRFVELVAQAAGDEEARDRRKGKRAARRLEADKRTTGWPTVRKILEVPEPMTDALRDWLGLRSERSDAEEVLAEMNARHAVVFEAGKTVVITEEHDPVLNRIRIDRSSFTDIKHFYDVDYVRVGTDNTGNPKFAPKGTFYLNNPARRQYRGVVFDPDGAPDGYFNLWRGFAFEPKKGDWSKFKAHLREVICAGDEERYRYLLGWLANVVQHPGRRCEVALVMRGGRGTGKGITAVGLGSLFGQHFLHISNARHLVGNFNSHLEDAVVLFADEAFWAGDKHGESVLKALITEPTIAVEAKYRNVRTARNVVHLIMASNAEWVVPAGLDERRFAVFEVNEHRKGDSAYFKAIADELDNGGGEAMLHDLLQYDLSGFDVRKVPQTEGLFEQKLRSMTPKEKWWYEKLTDGVLLNDHEYWETKVASAALHDDYVKTASKAGGRHHGDKVELGMFLARVLPEGYPGKTHVYVDVWNESAGEFVHKRVRGLALPELEACRASFDELIGSPVDWPEISDPPDDDDAPSF